MKFFLPLVLLAATAAAQTSTAAADCPAAHIVEACLGTTNAIAAACDARDFGCLCTAHKSIVGCFDSCPNDARRSSAQNARDSYCTNASLYSTSTTKAVSASSTPATTAKATTTDPAAATETTSSTATATKTNAAVANIALNAGGLLAGVAGAIAALL